ncbi:MAG: AAA family ATPase [Microbacterium sp.]
MAPERNENEGEDVVDNGVLATTDGTETTGIGIVEGVTAQVEVALPATFDDDDFDDDDVVQGEDVTLIEIAPVREVPDAPEQSPLAAEEPAPAASASVASASVASVSAASVPAAAATPAAVPAEPATPTDLDHHERVRPRTSEIALQSRRLGDFEVDRESSDLLTADRLLDPAHVVRPEPEGAWRHLVYTLSGRRINLGDSRQARARKQLDSRIAAPLTGGAKFVPVLSRKGGVGKTTVTTLLGMALADAREDRIIAVDANPDRGTLAERIGRPSGKTVRDLVRARADVHGFNDISQIVARDHTRLDVLASDSDPHVSRGLQRHRLPRRRRRGRVLLLGGTHRHRHRHRALGHAGDPRARR